MPLPPDACVVISTYGKKIDFNRPLDSSSVKDRVALITGGASGLGLAIAKTLAEHDAHVAIADRNAEAGEVSVRDLTTQGLSAKFFQVDTTSWESQLALFKAVLAWKDDTLDIVIPAAGVATNDIRQFIKAEGSEPARPPTNVFDVNLTGVYFTSYLALFYFHRLSATHKPGIQPQLLMVASLAGYEISNMGADYVSAKFGVRGLWKVLRSAAKDIGAQSNLLAPTFIDTPMLDGHVGWLTAGGAKIGTVDDFTSAAMRAICDTEVDGRAIAVAPGGDAAGSKNFDLEDDFDSAGGSKQLAIHFRDGTFGDILA